jgi:hypothetical protein
MMAGGSACKATVGSNEDICIHRPNPSFRQDVVSSNYRVVVRFAGAQTAPVLIGSPN